MAGEEQGQVLSCLLAPFPGAEASTRVLVRALSPDRLSVSLWRGPGFVLQLAGAEVLAVDPLNTPTLTLVPDRWLGGDGVAVVVGNAYVGTGRSMSTRALHLFRRSGERLELVFATYLQAEHSGSFGCAGGTGRMCRLAWSRRYVLSAGSVPPGQVLPVLTVRDARTGRTLAVRRPVGGRYSPDRFETLPAFAPP